MPLAEHHLASDSEIKDLSTGQSHLHWSIKDPAERVGASASFEAFPFDANARGEFLPEWVEHQMA